MAAKASVQSVKEEGFSFSQFGFDSDIAFDVFIQTILDESGLRVQERVGDVMYASTDALIINHIQRAERFFAASELSVRRINRLDSATASSNQMEAVARTILELRKNKTTYLNMAEAELAAVPASTAMPESVSNAPAFGAVASSHFSTSTNNTAGIGGSQ